MAKKENPVGKFFLNVANGIYSAISFVNLQYAVLVLLVGIVLFLTGVLNNVPIVKTIFFIVLALSIVLAIILTIRKLIIGSEKKKGKKEVGDVSDFNTENKKESVTEATNQNNEGRVTLPITEQMEIAKENGVNEKTIVYPIYSKVRQNNNYIMAEFEDRYELYFNSEKGLIRVRTDYKK
jgi:membrane protein implicated in regulation of membrane protease activity